MEIEQKLSLHNNYTSEKKLLVVEPWCEEYWIDPGTSVEVIGTGGKADNAFFEIDYLDNGIIVYGWTGSIVYVLKDGKEVEPQFGSY